MANERENDNYSLEDILSGDYSSDESYSLESILSEYKGSAYIKGEKKTPASELNEKVGAILRDVTGRLPTREELAAARAEAADEPEKPAETAEPEEPKLTAEEKPAVKAGKDKDDGKVMNIDDYREPKAIYSDESDEDSGKYFESKEFQDAVTKQLDGQDDWDSSDMQLDYDETANPEDPEEEEEGDDERPGFLAGLLSRFRKKDDGMEYEGSDEQEEEEEDGEEYEDEEEDFVMSDTPDEDYDLSEEISRFSAPVTMFRFRSWGAAAISVLILILTHMYTAGSPLPFGIGASAPMAVGVILIMQLLVMLLGLDVLISGVEDIVYMCPGTDSLVFVSSVFTFLDGFVMLLTHNYSRGLPFSLLSAVSIFFALRAKINYGKAMTDSLKMSGAVSNPYGVVTDTLGENDDERVVLKKADGVSDGFYHKLVGKDIGELLYSYAAPILVLAAFVFALLSSVGQGRGGDFAHSFALMTAVIAAFPSAAVFALPFSYAASGLKNTGAALAGWAGACDIYDADGALITDEDIFPAGSVSLSGIKFFEGFNNKNALQMASSVIVASKCGISGIFSELLKSQGLRERSVTGFASYEGGGVGGDVDGRHILAGSGAFMNLMGIRVPEKVNTVNSVFAAIDGELAVVYTVNYVPANSVRSALVSLLNTKINLLLALRDFNVTPNVIRQKFRVSMDGVEYLPAEDSYKLTEKELPESTRVSALLVREGLQPLADAITKGRLVKLVTELNSLISLGGTVIGLLLMFFLCSSGAFASASAENAFIFMLAIEVCVLLLSQLVRKRP